MFDSDPDLVIGFAWKQVSYKDGTAGKVGQIVDSRETIYPVYCAVLPGPAGEWLGVMVQKADQSYDWAPFDTEEEAQRKTELFTIDWLMGNGYLPFGIVGRVP